MDCTIIIGNKYHKTDSLHINQVQQILSKPECRPCGCPLISTLATPQSPFLSAPTLSGHQGRARRACLIPLFNGPVVEQPRITTRSLFVLLGSLNEVWLAPFLQLRSLQMDINHTVFFLSNEFAVLEHSIREYLLTLSALWLVPLRLHLTLTFSTVLQGWH